MKPKKEWEPTWDANKGPSDSQVDTAMQVLRVEYWTSIRSNAKALADDMRGGSLEPDDVYDRIHEEADGSHWTIYTHANYKAIMCSDHDPWEDVEEMGGADACLGGKSMGIAMAMLAFYCVRHHLRGQLEGERR